MKKMAVILILFSLLSSIVSGADLLKEGDNLTEYLQKNPVKYQMELRPISSWPEGKTMAYAYDTKGDGTSPIIIVVDGTYPIGVLQGSSPNAYYLFDSDGDGNLDLKTEISILPYWVVAKTSTKKTKKDNISNILDVAYQGYQSDEGPMFSTIMTIQAMEEFKSDKKLENRDLIYFLYFYTNYNQKLPTQSLNAINLLGDEYKSRFKKTHPLILLYKLETYINMDQGDNAREILKELRSLDPTFVPGMVYEYQLETDREKAKELLTALKKNHGNHWIVKKL